MQDRGLFEDIMMEGGDLLTKQIKVGGRMPKGKERPKAKRIAQPPAKKTARNNQKRHLRAGK